MAGCSGQAGGMAAVHRNSGAQDNLMKSKENPPGNVRPQHGMSTSAPGPLADSPAEAQGRRILSTAFVRLGPGGHLTVELRNGHMLVLRNVVMRPRDYCGVRVAGDPAGTRYCGGYGDVAAARPGGAAAPDEPNPALLNPVGVARSPSGRE